MNAKFLKATTFVVAGLFASVAVAQDDAAAPEVPAGPTPQEVAAQNMSALLDLVKQGRSRAAGENRAREQRFAQDKANQQSELNRAERERAAEERRSARLEKKFEDNELLIAAKQEQLKERLGSLSELFGHLTAASGDLASNIEVSLRIFFTGAFSRIWAPRSAAARASPCRYFSGWIWPHPVS